MPRAQRRDWRGLDVSELRSIAHSNEHRLLRRIEKPDGAQRINVPRNVRPVGSRGGACRGGNRSSAARTRDDRGGSSRDCRMAFRRRAEPEREVGQALDITYMSKDCGSIFRHHRDLSRSSNESHSPNFERSLYTDDRPSRIVQRCRT